MLPQAQAVDWMGGSNLRVVSPLKPSGRQGRRPKHTFRVRSTPWAIQPFMIAPVLPGETMKNLLLQARAATDPLKDKLGGWWNEYYFFYVKHTDLAHRDDLIAMHVENASITTLALGSDHVANYALTGQIDWAQMCLEQVTEWYFRDAGEAWNASGSTISVNGTTLPLAKAAERLWWDSLKLEAEHPTEDSRLPGQVDDLPPHMSAFQNAYDQWTWMRENSLTEATFEDYLKAFGVRAEAGHKEVERKPELIRYIRDWALPSNTVLAADGSINSACVWSVAERADKDRFFREPGFIFGVTVSRPKIYWSGQTSSAVNALTTPFHWLPATMRNDPYTSLVEHDHDKGPVPDIFNSADDYWWDARDLFLYGDQFLNFDPSADPVDDVNFAALPKSSGPGNRNTKYVNSTDINSLFGAYSTVPSDNGLNKVRIDGVVALNILSHQRDTT